MVSMQASGSGGRGTRNTRLTAVEAVARVLDLVLYVQAHVLQGLLLVLHVLPKIPIFGLDC